MKLSKQYLPWIALIFASRLCHAESSLTPNTSPPELKAHAISLNSPSQIKPPPKPREVNIDRIHRFYTGFRIGIALTHPSGVQSLLGDREAVKTLVHFSLIGGYRLNRRAALLVMIGREHFKVDTTSDTNPSFEGTYQVDLFPAFAGLAYDIFIFGGGAREPGQPVESRITFQGSILGGAALGMNVKGSNVYGQRITTGTFTLPGVIARLDTIWSKDQLPIGLDLGLGYRQFVGAVLGKSGKELDISGPSVDLGFLIFL